MNNCLFCKIIKKQIPSEIVYEDEFVIAFKDINPQAKVHILIVPKKHIETVDHLEEKDDKLVGALIYTAQKIARKLGIAENGYRLVFNVKSHGGQIIDHIHLHLIGGEKLGKMCL